MVFVYSHTIGIPITNRIIQMTIKKPLTLRIHAALFDVDGTIVDSSQPILDFWCAFGQDKPGFDGQYVFDHTHGWRTFDAIAKYAPEFADAEFVKQLEGQVPDLYGNSAKEIPGAIKLVESLLQLPTDGERLAVATSGTFDMASKWFKILGLQRPKSFITAESVKHGKPNPEPYLLGRKSLGYGDVTKKVVVFEDAPAGVTAGHGAGCLVIGIASTFDAETVKEFGADIVVPDLTGVKVIGYDQEKDVIEITIGNYIHVCDELAKTLESF